MSSLYSFIRYQLILVNPRRKGKTRKGIMNLQCMYVHSLAFQAFVVFIPLSEAIRHAVSISHELKNYTAKT